MVAVRRPRTPPGGVRGASACVLALAICAALARRADAEDVSLVPAGTQDASPDASPLALSHAQHAPSVDGYGGDDTALESAMVEWLQDEQRRRQRVGAAATVDRATAASAVDLPEPKKSANVSSDASSPPNDVSAWSSGGIVRHDRDAFVRVSGTRFVVGCPPAEYKVVGWNTYTLVEQAARVPMGSFGADFSRRGRAQVLEMLDRAAAAGFNTVRTWAYSVGERQPMQTHPGVYHEPSFEGLDWVLYEAGKRGVRLVLVLTDYWEHHGGVSQYLEWAAARKSSGSLSSDFRMSERKSLFFSDPDCKRMYKANAKALIERVNAYTGVAYRDDPTIFAWELINEPRCRGCGARLQAWIEEMARYVKRLDPNHMLSTGEEGFYAGDARGSARVNPEVWAATTGQDFLANHAVPEIDFAVAHLWPDNWGVFTLGGSLGAAFTEEWIRTHTRDATRVLGKPFVLEEFGVKAAVEVAPGFLADVAGPGGFRLFGPFGFRPFGGGSFDETETATNASSSSDETVASYYRDVYALVEKADDADRALRGSMFWTWHHDDLKPLARGADEYAVFAGDGAFRATEEHAAALRGRRTRRVGTPLFGSSCVDETTLPRVRASSVRRPE